MVNFVWTTHKVSKIDDFCNNYSIIKVQIKITYYFGFVLLLVKNKNKRFNLLRSKVYKHASLAQTPQDSGYICPC